MAKKQGLLIRRCVISFLVAALVPVTFVATAKEYQRSPPLRRTSDGGHMVAPRLRGSASLNLSIAGRVNTERAEKVVPGRIEGMITAMRD